MARDRDEAPFALNAPLPLPESTVPPERRRREPVIALAVVVVLAIVGLAVWLLGGSHVQARGTIVNADGSVVSMIAYDSPTLHQVTRPKRLLAPATPPAGPSRFAVSTDARWDPCLAIHYVVAGTAPFRGANELLASAISEVSRRTGLDFVSDGQTDEKPTSQRDAFQPARYGDKWAPVLIAWTDPTTVPDLAGDVAGEGGANAARLRTAQALVSGLVYLDGQQLADLANSREGQTDVRAIMLHELGHLVGLDHVHDPTSLMYPTQHEHGPTDFSSSDLRGLARAGNGPCLPYVAHA